MLRPSFLMLEIVERHVKTAATVLSFAVLAHASACYAVPTFTFTDIADTSTVAPGTGGETFATFGVPAISSGTVAFLGQTTLVQGIYTATGSSPSVIADTTMAAPGGGGTFTTFGLPTISAGTTAFVALPAGIYTGNGTLSALTRAGSPAPGGGLFTSFGSSASIDGAGTVAFRASTDAGVTGIYTATPSGGSTLLSRLVAVGDPAPSGGTFTSFGEPSIENGTVAFRAHTNTGVSGIYTATPSGGSTLLSRRVAVGDAAPGGGIFTLLGDPSIDAAGTVNFFAFTSAGTGIFTATSGGGLTIVAGNSTPIPDGAGNFTSFGSPAIDAGDVAFLGSGLAGQLGLYLAISGDLFKVVDLTDTVFGKTLENLGFFNEGLSGNALTFFAQFTDGSRAIVRADATPAVPEPATLLLVAAGLVVALLVRRLAHG
jgi:PEP-CTERM motif